MIDFSQHHTKTAAPAWSITVRIRGGITGHGDWINLAAEFLGHGSKRSKDSRLRVEKERSGKALDRFN